MDQKKAEKIATLFHQRFASKPLMVRSPGRVNLIGEHTDYNDGWVLPAAIDKETVLAMATNGTNTCNIFSWDLQQEVSFTIDSICRSDFNWANYIIGVIQQILAEGHALQGFDCVFGGDIPIGSGLSSSAALECGVGYGLSKIFKLNLSKLQIVLFAQKAEAEFVGVNCGVMDQYANMFGSKGHLIRLDCRDYTHRLISVDLSGYSILLFNSGVKHELGDTQYNIRREECDQGVQLIREHYSEVRSLRDCQRPMLSKLLMPTYETIYLRCEYVIEENQRVIDGCEDLLNNRLEDFGQKMYQSHDGLSSKYQVSCHELDLLVDLTRSDPAVLGARMMGGGFGGCTINLIKKEAAEEVSHRIASQYHKALGKNMVTYTVVIAQGTSLYDNHQQTVIVSSPKK